jgi:hypothetical protein
MIKCVREQIAVIEERLKVAKQILAGISDEPATKVTRLSALLGRMQLELARLVEDDQGWPWKPEPSL